MRLSYFLRPAHRQPITLTMSKSLINDCFKIGLPTPEGKKSDTPHSLLQQRRQWEEALLGRHTAPPAIHHYPSFPITTVHCLPPYTVLYNSPLVCAMMTRKIMKRSTFSVDSQFSLLPGEISSGDRKFSTGGDGLSDPGDRRISPFLGENLLRR